MAIIVAVRSGNWSDTSLVTGPWPGESAPTTKPGVEDTVQAGEYIIEIDEDVHVAMLEATGTGYFAVSGASAPTIIGKLLNNGPVNGALQVATAGVVGDIIGDLTAGNVSHAYALYNGGTVGDIIGDLTAGNVSYAYALYNNGTVGDIIGNLTAGNVSYAYALYNNGTVGDIIGNLTAGNVSRAYALYNGGGTVGAIDGSLICGAMGQFPIYGPFRMTADPANSITVRQPNGDPWTLSNDYPAEADVKSGVDYNRGTQTGELATGGSIGPVSIVIGGGGIRIF